MFTTFSNAPYGVSLNIYKIKDKKLESELFRMGIFHNSIIFKMDIESDMHTVRIKSEQGETILAGGMGGKIVAHLDDDRIIPLIEMKPKERGHIETIEGGEELAAAIEALGLKNGDEIQMVRCLPPMEYIVEVKGKKRIRLSEGMAAKILGSMNKKKHCQFANASVKVPFTVKQIIGGKNAKKVMESFDIKPNDILTLLSVENAPVYSLGFNERFMLSTNDGLRLFLKKEQADNLTVSFQIN